MANEYDLLDQNNQTLGSFQYDRISQKPVVINANNEELKFFLRMPNGEYKSITFNDGCNLGRVTCEDTPYPNRELDLYYTISPVVQSSGGYKKKSRKKSKSQRRKKSIKRRH
jgi:hypothetical protein